VADSGPADEQPGDAIRAGLTAPDATAEPGGPDRPPERIDQDAFRDVIGRFVSGVTVVTTAVGGEEFAATVSALTSVSLEPPMLLVCLNRTSMTQGAIATSGRFAVSILAEHQRQLARWFATKDPVKLDAVVAATGPGGLPVIREAAAYLECVVCETARGGTHTVFLAEVVRGWAGRGRPLVYYRGALGGFSDVGDRGLLRRCSGTRGRDGRDGRAL
jgi:4-nitrophenol 2-monooxygenase / 4-nitrocatechol 4-monooxygenase, reductase component